jgi:hypothetical protein
MPPFDRQDREDEDDVRDEFMRAFEAFDSGDLTSENAHTFELPDTKTAKDGDADGQGEKPAGSDQQTVSRDGQRDERGRFAKGEGEATARAAAETKPEGEKPAGQQQATEQPAAVSTPEPAPHGLSAKAAAAWEKATPEARDYIRETEGILAQVSDRLSSVMEGAKEHQLPWNEYAERLVKADKFLRSKPMDAMLWLIETHGIDPDALADMAAAKRAGIPLNAQQQTSPDINRAVQPLAAQVQEINSRLAQREEFDRREAERIQSERTAAVKREFDSFAQSAEHWKDVEKRVLALIPATRAQKPAASAKEILQEAYDTAIWADPAIRQKLLEKQGRAAQDVSRQARSSDLESLTDHRGAPSANSRRQTNGSADPLRDEIADAWAAFDAR